MESIKAWLLSICFASLAAGIIRNFTPQNEKNSVIKLVLTLYILIAAFAPIQALKYPNTRISLPEHPAYSAINTDEIVNNRISEQLKSELEKACIEKGVKAQISVETNNYDVESVTVDSIEAKEIVSSVLGSSVNIYVENK